MAYADYEHCEKCDAKAIYNAGDFAWQYGDGDFVVLCADCAKEDSVGVKSVIIRSPEAEAYWRGVIAEELESEAERTHVWHLRRPALYQAAAFVRGKTQEGG